MTKTAFSLVMRSIALAALFSASITGSLAAPYRYYQYQPGSMQWQLPSQSAAPLAGTYSAMTSPSVPLQTTNGAADYIAHVTQQGVYHWQSNKFPIKVWIGSGDGVPGYRPQFASYIRKGFDEWCRISNNKLAWTEVGDPSGADITVQWTNQVTERPEGTEAGKTDAMTRLDNRTGQGIIYGARMQFLTRLPDREFSDMEVAKTCMHEAGHAFGLQGHSPYAGDVMYYAVRANQMPRLSQRDINTMTRLYAGYPAVGEVAANDRGTPGQEYAN